MRRDDAFTILTTYRDELREAHHVRRLALFGSVARDEARSDSDADLLVEFDRPVGLFGLVGLQFFLEGILGVSVDVGTFTSLREYVRREAERDMVYVPLGPDALDGQGDGGMQPNSAPTGNTNLDPAH